MKNIQFVHLTTSGTLLFISGNQCSQSTLQGLKFNNSLLTRSIFKQHFFKQIQCNISKSNNKIKYHNVKFYQQILKLNLATLNEQQFQQTKLFTIDQKQQIKRTATEINSQFLKQRSEKILDYTTNRNLLPQLYSSLRNIKASIEYLNEQIIFTFQSNSHIQFLPVKLQHIDHFFQLIQPIKFTKFLYQNQTINVQLVNCFYNLNKQQYQIQALLPINIQKTILAQGWGIIAINNLNYLQPTLYTQLINKEKKAKTSLKGIFAKPVEILNFVYPKKSLTGIVQKIIEGHIYKIRCKDDKIIQIQLSKIYCPANNDHGSFACREFARQNLIGKEVHIFLKENQNKDANRVIGSIVRISDNKNIQTFLIENGYGFPKECIQRTMVYEKLKSLAEKAKTEKKGINNEKNSTSQFYEKLTVSINRKQKIAKKKALQTKNLFLEQLSLDEEGIIQEIIDEITYIVRIDSHKKIIKVKLVGVSILTNNTQIYQINLLRNNSQSFCEQKFYQRTVTLQLTEYNQSSNAFIGIIRLLNKGKSSLSFQQILLSHGFAFLSNKSTLQQKWIKCEEQAKSKQLNCWSSKLKQLIRNTTFELQDSQFEGKFSWIQNGQLAYVQPNSVSEQLDSINKLLNSTTMKKINFKNVVPGYLCAAQYFQQFCRASIISTTRKTTLLKFIDWGNKETVPLSALRELPQQLLYVPPLCCEVILDLVKPLKTKNAEHLQKLRQYAMQCQCTFYKSYGNIVNVFKKGENFNAALIHEGYLKADLSKFVEETQRKEMEQQMNWLRKELVGVWELEDNYADLEDTLQEYEEFD